MSIPETIPVLDLKPLQYNPFSDGTVVYDNAGGVLVPRSAGSMVDPLGENPLTQNRPSNASTQGLIDSARSTAKSGVKANAAALRGYQTTGGFFNTDAFERGLNHLSDSELDNFIDGLKTQGSRAAAEAAATAPRQAAQQALRRGSQFAGALGIAIDAYNVGDAILDPTNNPADEIGDVAGSMIGGALGSGLGPLGALGGSLVGGWLGRQLGNLLQGDGARARSHESSAPPFIGGQERGVTYKFRMKYRWYTFESGKGTPPVHTPWIEKISYWPHPNLAKKTFVGPATYKSIESISQSGSVEYRTVGFEVQDINGNRITGATVGHPTTYTHLSPVLLDLDIERVDGQPDTGGNPSGNLIPIVTPPTYAPTTGDSVPENFFGPLPAPVGDPLPAPTGGPWPAPTGNPLPAPIGGPLPAPTGEPWPAPTGGPSFDNPPTPDDLPGPRLQPPSHGPAVNPNPEPGCCDRNALNLQQLLRDVDTIKAHFHTSGFATLNLPDCEATAPYLLPWQGSGLVGIYDALETLSDATNRLWDQIKCPPDTTAAVPMAWDVKVVEHPQLIVLWAPVAGGSSRWSMHIPHPKANIDHRYGFSFPQYTKGPVRGTLILNDNTRVIVNGASETECKKVLNYTRTLIIPSYLTDAQEMFTKGSSKLKVQMVKAVYIKSFSGHKTQAPLWATGI